MNRTSLAAAVAVAGLALAASPAVAQAPFNGPNCQGGIVSDAVIGIGAKEAAANAGLTIQEAQDLIQTVCADVTTNTPRCEIGHGQAAQEALERGDLDQYLFHLGALFNCFLGEPPGPPL
jgi:hypothetical protein